MKYALKFDLVVEEAVKYPAGHQIEIRRPKSRDMIAIADDLQVLMALAPAEARPNDDGTIAAPDAAGEVDPASMTPIVYSAMTRVVGQVSGLGEDALDLDFSDLTAMVTAAFSHLGEARGGGAPPSGARRSRT